MNSDRREPPGWLRTLVRIDDAVARAEGFFVVASLGLMLLLYVLYVVFRNVSASLGEKWLTELPLQLVLWVTLFGGALAAREGRHISIDLSTHLLPPRALRVVRLLTNTLAVVMSVVLTWAGWRYLVTVELAEGTLVNFVEISFGETTILKIPTWLFVALAPLGFALTAWHFAVLTVREALGFPPTPAPTAPPVTAESDAHARQEGGA